MDQQAQPSNAMTLAKFFDMKGKQAMDEIRPLSDIEKQQLGDGIRNGTFTY